MHPRAHVIKEENELIYALEDSIKAVKSAHPEIADLIEEIYEKTKAATPKAEFSRIPPYKKRRVVFGVQETITLNRDPIPLPHIKILWEEKPQFELTRLFESIRKQIIPYFREIQIDEGEISITLKRGRKMLTNRHSVKIDEQIRFFYTEDMEIETKTIKEILAKIVSILQPPQRFTPLPTAPQSHPAAPQLSQIPDSVPQ